MSNARHVECTLAEYHAMNGSWSHSQAEVLIASPPLFHGRYVMGIWPREESIFLDAGTVAHAALLDQDGFEGVATIIPPEALNADGHRKGPAWKEWSTQHGDKILLKVSEADSILAMVNNVKANRDVRRLMRSGTVLREHSILWTDDATGLDLRSRPDLIFLLPDIRIIVADVKTTRAVTERAFRTDAVRYGYFRQAAWQVDAAKELFSWALVPREVAGFLFIVVDKSPAHECRIFEVSEGDLEVARQQNRATWEDLADRLAHDNWAGRDDNRVIPLVMPEWAKNTIPWEVNEQ